MAEAGYGDVLDWPVIAIHATLTPDGKILTFGTDQQGVQGAQLYYDVYDPLTQTHTTLTHTAQTDLFCCAAIILPGTGGKILLVGGDARPLGDVNAGVPDVNIYDFVNMTITPSPTGPMEYARWYATTTSLSSGQIVALGGRDENFGYNGYSEIYTHDVGWRTLTGAYIEDFETLSNYPRTWLASSGKLITFTADAGAAKVYAIDPSGSGSVEEVGQLPFVTAWWQPSIMFDVDRTLILADDGTAWIMDISGPAPVFTQTGSVDPNRKWSNFEILPDGSVLLSGGSAVDASNNNQLVDVNYSAAIWNPDTGVWTDADDAAIPRLYHSTTLLLPDGTIMSMGGGAPGPVTNLNAEVYTPSYLLDANGAPAVRPVILSAPSALEAGDTFSVTVDNPDAIETLALMAFGTTTHSFNMTARRIELAFTKEADGSLTVELPDNANVLNPGYWMLFAIDANGTPSVASTIEIAVEQLAYMPAVQALDLGVTFEKNGLAAYDGYQDAYVLTPDVAMKAGSVFSDVRVDLREAFSISFELNVGADDAGADGLAFVFHNDPNGAEALGYIGGAFGALGIANGLGIEFDIYDSSIVYPEPAADHTNFFDTDNLAGNPAVTAPTELANLEDGLWHKVDVVWNGTDTLSYSIDGVVVGTWTGDISAAFLGGSPFAYFGFTGGTGGATTQQQVRVLALEGTTEDGGALAADRGGLPVTPDISVHGTAIFDQVANEYVLTPDAALQVGSLMLDQRIDLAQTFTLTFQFHAGDDDAAADGLAFVLHNDPLGAAAIGYEGGALGALGIANGLGIEFDTYQNGTWASDIANDHTNFFDTDVLGADPALSAAVDIGNVEDGRWHTVKVVWDGQSLSYTVDGAAGGTLDADIAAAYLGGSQFAYLGLTAATGGATTEHKVRIVDFSGTAEDGTALEIVGPNLAPVAQGDSYTVASGGVLTIAAPVGLLANDDDPNGDDLAIFDASQLPNGATFLAAENGTLVVNADGSFTYTPDAGFVGIDSFRYLVSDGQTWAEGEVSIAVTDETADPTLAYQANGEAAFDEAQQAYVLTPDTPFSAGSVFSEARVDLSHTFTISFEIFLGASDLGADGMAFVLQNAGAGVSAIGYEGGSLGAIGIANGIGIEFDTFDSSPYDPFPEPADDHINVFDTDLVGSNPALTAAVVVPNLEDGQWHGGEVSWNGTDTLSYSVDGTLIGTWTGDITALLGGESLAHFGFTAGTGGGSNLQMARVTSVAATLEDGTVLTGTGGGGGEDPGNSAPTALLDAYTIAEDGSLVVPVAAGVLANDTDGNGDAITAIPVTGPLNGTLNLATDGSFSYVPFANYFGSDGFTYLASDGSAESAPVTVSIDVTAVNDAPVIALNGGLPLSVSFQENSLAAVATIAATDVDSASLAYSISGGADAGLFSIDATTGALAFAAAPDFEAAADGGANNVYDVIVSVADADGAFDTIAVSAAVANVAGVTRTGTSGANTLTGTGEEDTLSGLGGSDTLAGLGANDILNGGAGSDYLDGGTGADQMLGGAGNDTYVVDNAADTVTEQSGQGTDTVLTSLDTYALGANVENLTYTGGGDFTGTGNDLANTLTGGAGADTLSGGGGNDTIVGGAGNDTLSGGAGNDIFVFNPGFGNDVITSFGDASGNNDILQFSTSLFASYAAVQTAMAQAGGDILITATASDSLTIKNKTVATLNANDMQFV